MHMLTNLGMPYVEDNLSDTMFYIRFAHDNLKPEDGGPPLGLKEYATQYIDRTAALHERGIKDRQSRIAKELNMRLRIRLGAGWTLKKLDDFFKDKLNTLDQLGPESKAAYLAWLHNDVPIRIRDRVDGLVEGEDIPYDCIDRDTVITYAHNDIILTLEVFDKLDVVLRARRQERGLSIEEATIVPLYEMERTGFAVDKQYLLASQKNVRDYILLRREHLYDLAGRVLSVGQHEVIKNLLKDRFGIPLTTTRDEELSRVVADLQHEDAKPEAVDFITTIKELRTLEKWFSVYICRFIKNLERCDRLYTTINQVGAVSGRVTSDFQQFPKKGLLTNTGEELFHPRKMVQVSGGDLLGILYLDYSQIELRLQAIYTMLVRHPDMNLCRAFMPYKCVHEDGHSFDCHNPEDIAHWKDVWYLMEEPTKRWEPVDLHGAMAKIAFDVNESDPNWDDYRAKGKRVDFAKNYGAQLDRIRQMFPKNTEEQNRKINDAYYKAFPGILYYHEYCYNIANVQSYVTNLFGVRYYGVSGHNLKNMLIQGSGAYFLKLKIRELYDYRKQHNIRSPWQMQIHDELSWERHRADDAAVFFEFKRIMEYWPETLVPIVAEMEYTTTTWANKKKVHGTEDLNNVEVCNGA
jgi:DNA polymerase-1